MNSSNIGYVHVEPFNSAPTVTVTTTTTPTVGDTVYMKPETKSTCPNCGYCPHCGRAAQPYPIMPWYPQPYYPYPYSPWYSGDGTITPTITWCAMTSGAVGGA